MPPRQTGVLITPGGFVASGPQSWWWKIGEGAYSGRRGTGRRLIGGPHELDGVVHLEAAQVDLTNHGARANCAAPHSIRASPVGLRRILFSGLHVNVMLSGHNLLRLH